MFMVDITKHSFKFELSIMVDNNSAKFFSCKCELSSIMAIIVQTEYREDYA